ncbi:hypothetical protein ACFOPX_06525 [Helicobacter baculiformis]|uniref:Uncharacterized protein n=1 Tax=Helicobacter baculiformis TaxID=427351 RepID=A0ABV7ZL78_9HELI|nr:hypothetical protein [Helicobacter baculiformis]
MLEEVRAFLAEKAKMKIDEQTDFRSVNNALDKMSAIGTFEKKI